MKSVLMVALVMGLLLAGCATDTGRPLSENGRPLQLQIVHTRVTSETQIFKGGIAFRATPTLLGSENSTYRGPVKEVHNSVVSKPSESFLIVVFKIAGVTRTLQLTPSDVFVVDNKGVFHQTLGTKIFSESPQWYPFLYTTILPESSTGDKLIQDSTSAYTFSQDCPRSEQWIFSVPDDAMQGATISFQGIKYPILLPPAALLAPLVSAAERGDATAVQALLAKGADVNAKTKAKRLDRADVWRR